MYTLRFSSMLILLLAAIWNVGCSSRSAPESATELYIDAIWQRRCADARQHLSARTNHALEYLHRNPQRRHDSLPTEEYYCGRFAYENCKLSQMTLKALDGDNATVQIPCGKTQDSFLPGWPSAFLKYEPRSIELVLEDAEWKVVEPHIVRIVELREREDELREKALREQERLIREHADGRRIR